MSPWNLAWFLLLALASLSQWLALPAVGPAPWTAAPIGALGKVNMTDITVVIISGIDQASDGSPKHLVGDVPVLEIPHVFPAGVAGSVDRLEECPVLLDEVER